MGILRTLFGVRESAAPTTPVDLAVQLHAQYQNDIEVLQEGLADLELALEDEGWSRISSQGEREFSRPGLVKAAALARVMATSHPLVKRGLGIRQAYVWGQGVEITVRADNTGGQDVNEVVQAFLDDDGNQRAFSGGQAREEMERVLGTDGNAFFALFTNPRNGFVQVRSIPFDEVVDVISNPGDKDDPWYYRREWSERAVADDGRITTTHKVAFYPAVGYRPVRRPKFLDQAGPVEWDAPIVHVSVNRLDGWTYGIGDAYASLPWARAYKDFLADWAVLVKSLSQFAWRATSKGSKAQALRQKLARRPAATSVPGNENTVGATAVTSPDVTLEAIPKTGAVIDSESGRPMAAMIAAGLDVPVTTLLSDPGQTGARAVAETLNLPTRLVFQQRQGLWGDTIVTVLNHVIDQAVKTPQGPLRGVVGRDPFTGRETVTLAGDVDRTIDVTWPPLDEIPVETIVKAIVAADGTGKMPPVTTIRLLLQALGVEDVDTLIEDMTDENGQWVDPLASAGQAAVDAYRRGDDPAQVA
ncbi:hypothetical protein [Occultella kanbiaonis]|uniref:hypothetical protein n=1 Tax=Occultella kanbiaonis TaxID=2675754 RepID=UPI0013D7D042|nr:hypothetical protein [Occultella kanbiaonis]